MNLGAAGRFNSRLALAVTESVGTMWCAYAFAALALVSLPEAVGGGVMTFISWLSQTFIQLVMLSIIIVAGDLIGKKTEARDNETHDAVMSMLAELHTTMQEVHSLHVDIHAMGHCEHCANDNTVTDDPSPDL